jgi:hypothetical protein
VQVLRKVAWQVEQGDASVLVEARPNARETKALSRITCYAGVRGGGLLRHCTRAPRGSATLLCCCTGGACAISASCAGGPGTGARSACTSESLRHDGTESIGCGRSGAQLPAELHDDAATANVRAGAIMDAFGCACTATSCAAGNCQELTRNSSPRTRPQTVSEVNVRLHTRTCCLTGHVGFYCITVTGRLAAHARTVQRKAELHKVTCRGSYSEATLCICEHDTSSCCCTCVFTIANLLCY